jgi:hypothetical protein
LYRPTIVVKRLKYLFDEYTLIFDGQW